MNFIALCSSRGTTFQAVLDRIADGSLKASCLGLITDKDERGCIEKAEKADIPVTVVEKQKGEMREDYDQRLHEAIEALGNVDVIACLGWMFIFTPWFIEQWRNRIINVHPALLPKYGGEGMYGMHVHEAVLAAGEHESGMTIHLMDEGVDTGQILLQKTCEIEEGETPESLKDKVQALEKQWYPKVLEMIEEGTLQLP